MARVFYNDYKEELRDRIENTIYKGGSYAKEKGVRVSDKNLKKLLRLHIHYSAYLLHSYKRMWYGKNFYIRARRTKKTYFFLTTY